MSYLFSWFYLFKHICNCSAGTLVVHKTYNVDHLWPTKCFFDELHFIHAHSDLHFQQNNWLAWNSHLLYCWHLVWPIFIKLFLRQETALLSTGYNPHNTLWLALSTILISQTGSSRSHWQQLTLNFYWPFEKIWYPQKIFWGKCRLRQMLHRKLKVGWVWVWIGYLWMDL